VAPFLKTQCIYITTYVMHSLWDTKSKVTFPATEHCHCSLATIPTEGMRLSWPEWLVTIQDGIHANGQPFQY